jgi:PAS domain S-box-containing protein
MKPTKAARGGIADFTDEIPLLIDSVQDYAIFVLGPTGEIRTWNTGAARLMGYTADEALGRNFSMFYGPTDLENRKPQHELEVAQRDGRIEDEGWRLRKDGTRFWANTVITALRNEDGSIRGFAKVTRDLTPRREAEERLRQSEEMFRLLVASVKDYAIFLLDPQGVVVTWNAGAQAIKGYAPHEIIGKHFSTFYPEEDRRAGKTEWELRVARAEGRFEEEGWRVRKDGTRFWASVVITAVRDETGELRGFAIVTRDITDRKRAEEVQAALMEQREARLIAEEEKRRAEASLRAAEEANQAKDEFLMTLSHELRTPMTAIMGWSRLLPTLAPTDPIVPQALTSIARSADLQAQLIDDVLDVSRIVSGKLRLRIQPVEVTTVLNAAVDAVRPGAAGKNTTITTSFASDLGTIMADPTRLQQIVWNLLSNAVKFTPKGGRIEITARRLPALVEISVRDTGEGIDPALLPHIFEPFRQAESPQTRVHGGLGLGLSIVRYLIEAQGGTVTAESAGKGQGAKFTVTLPIGAVAQSFPQRPSSSRYTDTEKSIAGRLAGISIVVVDDDPEARSLITTTLRQAGASVTAAASAAEGLAALEKEKPDVVLTDLAMPHVDGYQLAREIRGRDTLSGVKIIALTAFGEGGKNQGQFDAYLNKPIDPFGLVDSILDVARPGGGRRECRWGWSPRWTRYLKVAVAMPPTFTK